jgi:protein-L-isoaspartate(D-aspartate) O-methyltransferase
MGTLMIRASRFAGLLVVFSVCSVASSADDEFEAAAAEARAGLMVEVELSARLAAEVTGRERISPRVMQALGTVPRHKFVPEELLPLSYQNMPLPIGYGRSLSQPFIVALMTDLLDLKQDQRVLEVGTGTGYQAAVLAQLSNSVCSVEIHPELFRLSSERLKVLGYGRVKMRNADGYEGWEDEAPFDAIVVRGAVEGIPGPLLHQLAPGGRMVVPLGPVDHEQVLTLVEKGANGEVTMTPVLSVRFVPLPKRDEPSPDST